MALQDSSCCDSYQLKCASCSSPFGHFSEEKSALSWRHLGYFVIERNFRLTFSKMILGDFMIFCSLFWLVHCNRNQRGAAVRTSVASKLLCFQFLHCFAYLSLPWTHKVPEQHQHSKIVQALRIKNVLKNTNHQRQKTQVSSK